MSPELARALLFWHGERQTVEVRLTPKAEAILVAVLPAAHQCPPILLDDLLQRFGSEQLILTTAGWGVPVHLLGGVLDTARRVLKDAGLVVVPIADSSPPDRESEVPTQDAERKVSVPPMAQRRRGFVPWMLCNPAEVESQLKRASDNHRERKRVLEALLARPIRYLPLTLPQHVRTVMDLREDFPNFSPVIEILADGLSLRARMKAPLKLPPTLLMGAPGLGKTAFSKELAKRLGFELSVRSLAEMSAAFVLIGGSSSWSDSRPGLIAVLLADMPDDRVPLLMLDELDKARSGSNYPPDVALLGLLENHTARSFREENLDLSLNLEPVSYLLTGNRIEPIRPEILSRLQMAEIRMPTQAEMRRVVASVDKVLRQDEPGLSTVFAPLSEEVMGSLSAMPPRQLRAVLQAAYSRVARRDFQRSGRLAITLGDLQVGRNVESEKAQSAPQARPLVIPFLMIDPAAWWRIH